MPSFNIKEQHEKQNVMARKTMIESSPSMNKPYKTLKYYYIYLNIIKLFLHFINDQ